MSHKYIIASSIDVLKLILVREKCNYNSEIPVNNKEYIKVSMSGVFQVLFREKNFKNVHFKN